MNGPSCSTTAKPVEKYSSENGENMILKVQKISKLFYMFHLSNLQLSIIQFKITIAFINISLLFNVSSLYSLLIFRFFQALIRFEHHINLIISKSRNFEHISYLSFNSYSGIYLRLMSSYPILSLLNYQLLSHSCCAMTHSFAKLTERIYLT